MLCVMVLGAMAVEPLYEGPAHDAIFYGPLAGNARSGPGFCVDVWGPPKPNNG